MTRYYPPNREYHGLRKSSEYGIASHQLIHYGKTAQGQAFGPALFSEPQLDVNAVNTLPFSGQLADVSRLMLETETLHEQIQTHHLALESLSELHRSFGSTEQDALAILSFESIAAGIGYVGNVFGPANTVSLEHIEASMEVVTRKMDTLFERYKATVSRLFYPLWSLAKINMVGLKSLMDKSDEMGTPGTIEMPVKYLGGDNSNSLANYYTGVADNLTVMVGSFADESKDAFFKNRTLVWDSFSKPKDGYERAAGSVLSGWADPRKLLTTGQVGMVYPNGARLFDNRPSTYHGTDPYGKAFDALANQNYPTIVSTAKANVSSVGDVEVNGFSKEQIRALCEKFYNALSQIERAKIRSEKIQALLIAAAPIGIPLTFGLWAIPLAVALNRRPPNTSYQTSTKETVIKVRTITTDKDGIVSEEDSEESEWDVPYPKKRAELETIDRALVTAGRMCIHTTFDSARVLVQCSSIFMSIAKDSMKAAKT
jgi:hypothetical protein